MCAVCATKIGPLWGTLGSCFHVPPTSHEHCEKIFPNEHTECNSAKVIHLVRGKYTVTEAPCNNDSLKHRFR